MKKALLFLLLASAGALVAPVFATPTGVSPIVSRAEALKVLINDRPELQERLNAFRADMPPIALFNDVPQDNNLAPYLEVAFERGIIKGNADRLFRPTQAITEAELVALHARMIAYADPLAASGLEQPNDNEAWYQSSLRILQAHGIDTPKPFSPSSPARRTSVGHMTHQVLAFVEAEGPVLVASNDHQPSVVAVETPVAAPNVPQFLPVRQLQPIITSNDNGAAINAGQGTNVAVAASPSDIYVGQVSSAGSTVTGSGTPTFIDAGSNNGGNAQISNGGTTGGGAMIDAGGSSDVDAGSTTFTITIPRLGIGPLLVSNPEDPFTHNGLLAPLKTGVGHLFSTPGAGGKILVYGHSSSYPWDVSEYTKIFRRINELEPGDEIIVDYNGQQFRYAVSYEEAVPAKDLTAYQDDGTGEDLILYTCWPPDSITQRYLVHAKPV